MTTYVCAELLENQCTTWVVAQNSVLPELTVEQAFVVCGAISAVLILAWGFRTLGRFINNG